MLCKYDQSTSYEILKELIELSVIIIVVVAQGIEWRDPCILIYGLISKFVYVFCWWVIVLETESRTSHMQAKFSIAEMHS